MYPIASLILAALCCLISKRIFRSLLTPLSLYSIAWSAMLVLHSFMSNSLNAFFYEPRPETITVVFLAWGVWIAGCLSARLGWRSADKQARHTVAMVSERRLRLSLVSTTLIGLMAPAINLLILDRLGVLYVPGEAWREAHFLPIGSVWDSILGALAQMGITFGWTGIYTATILAVYAIVRHRTSLIWIVIPVASGVVADLLIAGRFWLGYSPILVLVTWLLVREMLPRPGGAEMADQRELATPGLQVGRLKVEGCNFQPFGLSLRACPERSEGAKPPTRKGHLRVPGMIAVAFVFLIAIGGMQTIVQLRTSVATYARMHIVIGPFDITGFPVGLLLYYSLPLALLDHYVYFGLDWDLLYGQIAVGGLLQVISYVTAPFKINLVRSLNAYVVATNQFRPVGPSQTANFLGTYLLPAMSDFSTWGIVLYPLVFAFVSTRLFLRMQRGWRLRDVTLYALVALLVILTTLRWELISPTYWLVGVYLLGIGRWVEGERR
jgi:hypothetical protein